MTRNSAMGSEIARARFVITVDGLAGSGKTSLSRGLAEKTGFTHFSSGALYRVLAFMALHHGVNPDDAAGLCRLLSDHRIDSTSCQGRMQVLLDGVEITGQLHSPEVSEATSKASRHKEVRLALIEKQRTVFPGLDLVAEGRDMGTVVFPSAPLKFFVTAPEEVRVERRLSQFLNSEGACAASGNKDNLLKKMRIEITERDRRDSQRAHSPTKPAPDAIVVVNAGQTLTEVLDYMYHLALDRKLVQTSRDRESSS